MLWQKRCKGTTAHRTAAEAHSRSRNVWLADRTDAERELHSHPVQDDVLILVAIAAGPLCACGACHCAVHSAHNHMRVCA